MRITTVSSGLITTQALISGVAPCGERGFGSSERNVETEREAAAGCRGGADHEGAPVDLWHVSSWLSPPQALAAAWMAARTCWKVPQRQMLVMASLMSASVGLGLSFRSAATAMIMPAWQ